MYREYGDDDPPYVFKMSFKEIQDVLERLSPSDTIPNGITDIQLEFLAKLDLIFISFEGRDRKKRIYVNPYCNEILKEYLIKNSVGKMINNGIRWI
jgi:hypothetical protein